MQFHYWNAIRVRQAVLNKFGVSVSVSTIRRAMKRMGLTPQKPTFRSYRRKEAEVSEWLSTTFPNIHQKGK